MTKNTKNNNPKQQKPLLEEKYINVVTSQLKKEFGIKNTLAVPKIEKVVINMGVGDAIKNREILQKASDDLAAITGQKPSIRQAKISVASFGVRKGMSVGLKVTLRSKRKYLFLDKLISIALPRLRDFRGISHKGFDKQGNYSLGIREHSVFPEIDITKSSPRGLEITIVTSTNDVDKSKRLLQLLGLPFEKV